MIRYFIKLLAAFEVNRFKQLEKSDEFIWEVNKKISNKETLGKNLNLNNLMNYDHRKCPFFFLLQISNKETIFKLIRTSPNWDSK